MPLSGDPIAVLGGGLSGLITALHLSRHLPSHKKIVLYEAQDRLGGWVESESVRVPSSEPAAEGLTIIEGGPRSIRPKGLSGWTMIELIHSLDLMSRLVIVPSNDPSARNRFISFRGSLNRLPSTLFSALRAFFTLPVLRSLLPSMLPALIREPFRPSQFQRATSKSSQETLRQRGRESMLDEDVETFVRRRFGDAFGGKLVENLLSAVIHGIYACDARSLSVRSAFPFLWETEQQHGSLLRAFLPPKLNTRFRAPDPLKSVKAETEVKEIARIKSSIGLEHTLALETASVYSLRDGIGEVVKAVQHELLRRGNVEIRLGQKVHQITRDDSGVMSIVTASTTQTVSRIVSAIPSTALAAALDGVAQSSAIGPLLRHNPSTTVGVVNFVIPNEVARAVAPECVFLNHRARHITGPGAFGFLVPRCESNADQVTDFPPAGNVEGILGVVFDSDAIKGQDEVRDGVTKLTVMIGGPHFAAAKANKKPLKLSEMEVLRRAVDALHRHLAIPQALTTHQRIIARVRLQYNCIPTYLPGHFHRMWQLHRELLEMEGMTVTGASYTGVSVNDVVTASKRSAESIVRMEAAGQVGGVTGLENFVLDHGGAEAAPKINSTFGNVPGALVHNRFFSTSAQDRALVNAFSRASFLRHGKRRTAVSLGRRRAFSTSHSTANGVPDTESGPLPACLSSATYGPLRFIYFSIFNTLVRPHPFPGLLYARWAHTRHGLPVDYVRAQQLYPKVFADMEAQYPLYGKGSEKFPTYQDWWAEVIDRVLIGAGSRFGAAPGDGSLPKGKERVARAQAKLGPDATYEDLYNYLRKPIIKRCIQMTDNNETYDPLLGPKTVTRWIKDVISKRRYGGLPVIGVGLASNCDPSIKQACKALGVNGDLHCVSYEVGASKPDPAFFAAAIKRARVESPGQILFIGDSLEEDAIPAARAGMRSIWLYPKPDLPKPMRPTQLQMLSKLGERKSDHWERYETLKLERRQLVEDIERRYVSKLRQAKERKESATFDAVHSYTDLKQRLRQIFAEEKALSTRSASSD